MSTHKPLLSADIVITEQIHGGRTSPGFFSPVRGLPGFDPVIVVINIHRAGRLVISGVCG